MPRKSMKMLPLLLALVIALAGCSSLQPNSSPRYTVDPEYSLDTMLIQWIRVDHMPDMQFNNSNGIYYEGRLLGISFPFPELDPARCIIVAPMPEKDRDDSMAILGHEITHCFHGRWHPRWTFKESAGDYRSSISLSDVRQAGLDVLRQFQILPPDKLLEIETLIKESHSEQ